MENKNYKNKKEKDLVRKTQKPSSKTNRAQKRILLPKIPPVGLYRARRAHFGFSKGFQSTDPKKTF
jgi:hypothetical protein